MNSWTENLIRYWRSEQVQLNEGTLIEMISEAEEILHFRFPGEFKELYLQMDGFAAIGKGLPFSMWSVDRILYEHAHHAGPFIGFAELIQHPVVLGFRKQAAGIYLRDKPEAPVAASFREGLELIVHHSELLIH
ncbi:SMI1/KNR4 family protein [Chitinophaga sp. Cy-1792]|uniref:SMI1/KNR4 family protein n=1 Tax=Chitinophaga sp. Cy-1792 TaxID=2608339 RepID=UPI0014230E34|nr:SMI1/KNR4 family protein [Chitinophaga sp. Cy-1792]NIG55573.1 SMI1/KNR4 family protein [Chitinophaga sp. Cy-1792]